MCGILKGTFDIRRQISTHTLKVKISELLELNESSYAFLKRSKYVMRHRGYFVWLELDLVQFFIKFFYIHMWKTERRKNTKTKHPPPPTPTNTTPPTPPPPKNNVAPHPRENDQPNKELRNWKKWFIKQSNLLHFHISSGDILVNKKVLISFRSLLVHTTQSELVTRQQYLKVNQTNDPGNVVNNTFCPVNLPPDMYHWLTKSLVSYNASKLREHNMAAWSLFSIH